MIRFCFFFFSSRRRHTRYWRDWSSDVCSSDDNELMTGFRKQIANASPPDMRKYAEDFVKDHPESAVAPYLVNQYFMETVQPDYVKALSLLTLLSKEQPKNGYLNRLLAGARQMKDVTMKGKLKDFYATDMKGDRKS